jgi:hypothetical protein
MIDAAIRMGRFPGIGFRGDDFRREAWVIGTGLDVSEIVDLLERLGSVEALVADLGLTEAHMVLATRYRDAYPEEIGEALAENRRSPESWPESAPFIEFRGQA